MSMEVLHFVTHPTTAITYYRLSVPLETMHDLEYDISSMVDDFHPKITDKERLDAIQVSEIIHAHLITMVSAFPDPHRIVKSAPLYDNISGRIKFPATMILDVDDCYDKISVTNPAYANWGVLTPEGKLLKDGDQIIATMEDGSQELLWGDGEPYEAGMASGTFSVKKNFQNHARAKWLMQRCNAVTVTTPFLKKYYEDLHGLDNVYVFPNCIRFDHYDQVELREHPHEVRILWQGGSSHFEDLKDIRQNVINVLKRYPHAKFIMFGQEYKWWVKLMPPGQFEMVPWVPYDRYRLKLSTLGHDINLCPLLDTEFNLGKSAIKWYESTAICRPAVTLAANVGPYKEIEDGKTGLLYNTPEEFEEKLCTLIESATLRAELAGNAVQWLHENRDAKKEVPKLWEFYQQARKEHIDSFELMPAGV